MLIAHPPATDGPAEGAGPVDPLWWSQVFELSECLSFPGLSEGREVRLGRCAAAVVGGVVGPVSAAGSLPGHGDTDVDAEESGEHGGGQFGGQAEQRCRSILSGAEPELAQSFAEVGGADGPVGPSAGKQPAGGSWVAEAGVAVAGGDELACERGEG